MAPSSRKKKQQLKIVSIPSLLHQPPSGGATAVTVARSFKDALEELAPSQQQGPTSSKSSSAAGVPHVGVVLQATGWLGRVTFEQECTYEVYNEANDTMVHGWAVATSLLQQRDKLTLDHLRPALRPCPEDGVTPEAVYSFNMVAEALLEHAATEDNSDWVSTAVTLTHLWCCFMEACILFHSRKLAPAALLLTGPLLQLVAATLEHCTATKTVQHVRKRLMRLLCQPMFVFVLALAPSAHPGLRRWLPSSSSSSSSSSRLSPQQVEVCGANINVGLQQQELRWRAMAATVAAVFHQAAAKQVLPRPLLPESSCPDYGAKHTWPLDHWPELLNSIQAVGSGTLSSLVQSELWWLWPWQLQVLEAAAAVAASAEEEEQQEEGPSSTAPVPAATAAAAAAAAGCGTSDSQATVGHGATCPAASGDSSSHSASSSFTADIRTSGSNGISNGASSSSSSGTHNKVGIFMKGVAAEGMSMFRGTLMYPLTPALVAPGSVPPPQCPLPPVTRQQLQLVLGLLVEAGGNTFNTAALLLVLLLQRADHGLRVAFLNGPEASLLLTMLVAWGCHAEDWGSDSAPMLLGLWGMKHTWEGAVQLMIDILVGGDVRGAFFGHPASALLVLALCYLEPSAPRHLEGQQQPQLVATVYGPSILHMGGKRDNVAVVPVPAEDLRLVQGVVPTPQLVGTLEALARVMDPTRLLWVGALVAACCRSLIELTGAGGSSSSNGSSSNSGKYGGGSSSSGSHSSSSAGAGTRSEVLQALASMAVGLAATVDTRPIDAEQGRPMLITHSRLTSSAHIAADLLQLAAHEVAAGRAGWATLALAAAAQQLARACSDKALPVMDRLKQISDRGNTEASDRPPTQEHLEKHAAIVAYAQQRMLHGLRALGAAVTGWQQRGSASQDVCGNHMHGMPPQAACEEQQQQQQEEEVHVQCRQEQEEAGQRNDGQQPCFIATQKQAHAYLPAAQQFEEFCSYRHAVAESALEVTAASRTGLCLAGCSWAGCNQQNSRGRYSADAAVAGLRGVRCGGCGLARYCCPQHQQQDWPRHRHVCRRLARARAAAGGAAAGGGGGGTGSILTSCSSSSSSLC